MALPERSRRFTAPKRVPYPLPVSLSLCCAAPHVPSAASIRCTKCRNATDPVHVRHLGQVYGAKLGDRTALGITAAEAVRAIRDMIPTSPPSPPPPLLLFDTPRKACQQQTTRPPR